MLSFLKQPNRTVWMQQQWKRGLELRHSEISRGVCSQSSVNYGYTRQELYDLVWSTPMVKLAKEFGLSDVGLRKTCVKHGILIEIPLFGDADQDWH
jgi:hypothetical protein